MKLLLFTLLALSTASAQVGPVKGKGQSQSTYSIIERLQTKNSSLTVTGDKAVLFEGDPDNLLLNPSFEHQTTATSWTVNAGTPSTETTTVYDGAKALSLSLSAVSGDILTQCVTPSQNKGGTNLKQSLFVKTSLANLQVCSVIGSTEQQCNDVPAIGSWVEVTATSVAQDATAMCVKLKSTTSVTGTVKVDHGYVGKNKNVGTVQQANLVGSAYIPTTGSCNWTRTNSTVGAFSTTSACPGPTVDVNAGPGVIQTTDTDLPQFTVNNLPAGQYKVTMNFTAYLSASGNDAGVAMSDGTDVKGYQDFRESGAGGGDITPFTLVGVYTYTSSGNRTFSVYAGSVSSTVTLRNDSAYSRVSFTIEKFPAASEQAMNIDCGATGACLNTFTATVSSGGTVSNENVDWINGNCTNPTTGNYVCTFNSGFFSQAPNCTLTNTTSGQYASGFSSAPTTSSVAPQFVNTSSVAGINASFVLNCNRQGTDLRPNLNAPLLTGSVTTSGTGVERVERALVTQSGGTYTLVRSSSGITSVTKNAGGDTTLNFAAGTFSVAPACVYTGIDAAILFVNSGLPTTAGARMLTYTLGGSTAESGYMAICMGPR